MYTYDPNQVVNPAPVIKEPDINLNYRPPKLTTFTNANTTPAFSGQTQGTQTPQDQFSNLGQIQPQGDTFGEPTVKPPQELASYITGAAQKYGLSPSLLSGLIYQESRYNPQSSAITPREQSYGLGQINLMAHPEITKQQAMDPAFATDWVDKRLKSMVDKHGLYEGIQGYNTEGAIGSTALKKYADTILKNAGYQASTTPKTQSILNFKGAVNPKNVQNIFNNLGTETTKWGETTRYEKFHPGIDIANVTGTPIPSFTPGIVTATSTGHVHGEKGYGNSVTVTDALGNKHRYSHLQNVNVRPGQKVNAGTLVGKMGASGSTYSPSGKGEGTHLDYRIVSAANKYLNPNTYLSNFYKLA